MLSFCTRNPMDEPVMPSLRFFEGIFFFLPQVQFPNLAFFFYLKVFFCVQLLPWGYSVLGPLSREFPYEFLQLLFPWKCTELASLIFIFSLLIINLVSCLFDLPIFPPVNPCSHSFPSPLSFRPPRYYPTPQMHCFHTFSMMHGVFCHLLSVVAVSR